MVTSKREVIFSIMHRLYPVILGLISAGVILIITSRYNAGVTPDSVLYMTTARNIEMGKGIINFTGAPTVTEPPLYPMVLAVVQYIFNVDPLFSARFINALLFGLVMCLSGLLFSNYLRSTFAFLSLGTIYVVVSATLVKNSLAIWSDTLFVFFVVLFLIFSKKYSNTKDVKLLVLLSLLSSLASLTRYIGLSLIISGLILILLNQYKNLAVKLWHFFLFGFISILPVALYLMRNYILSHYLFGYDPIGIGKSTIYESMLNIYQSANFTFEMLLNWYVPENIIKRPLLMMVLGFVIGIIAVLAYRGNWKKSLSLIVIDPNLLFVIVYLCSLLLIKGPANYIENRFLSPVYIPLTLLLLVLSEKILRPLLFRISPKYGNLLFVVVVGIGLIYPAIATIQLANEQGQSGSGYTGETWIASQTIQYVIQHHELKYNCTFYTNDPYAMYQLAGMNVSSNPNDKLSGWSDPGISAFKGTWPPEGEACLVWFNYATLSARLSSPPENLLSIARVQKVIQFQDGIIYILSRQ